MPHYQIPSRPARANGHSPASVAQSFKQQMSVSDEAIARRAYEKFMARGHAHGFDQQDWETASKELMAEAFGQYGLSTREGDF